MAEIDNLSISITTNAAAAALAVNSLSHALQQLGNVASNTSGIEKFANSLNKLSVTKGLESLANCVSKLGRGFAELSKVSGSIVGLSTELNEFSRSIIAVPDDKFDAFTSSFSKFANGINAISRLSGNIVGYTTEINEFAGAINIPKIDGFEEFSNSLNTLASALNRLGKADANGIKNAIASLSEFSNIDPAQIQTAVDTLSELADIMNKISMGARALPSVMSRVSKATKTVAKANSALTKTASKSTGAIGKLFASIGRVAVYRAIRFIIKEITESIGEGMDRFKEFSKLVKNEYNQALTESNQKTEQLKNQLGSLMSEVQQTIMPIWVSLINILIQASNVLTQFFAALQGKNGYYRAKELTGEFANELADADDSATSLKNTLLGFDEINRLDAPSNELTAEDYSSMYEWVDGLDPKIQAVADTFRKIGKWIDENIITPLDELFGGTGTTESKLLSTIKAIGIAFAAWTIGNGLLNAMSLIKSDSGSILTNLSNIAALGAIVIGVNLLWDGWKDITDNDPTNDIIGTVKAALGSALGGAALTWLITGGNWAATMSVGLACALGSISFTTIASAQKDDNLFNKVMALVTSMLGLSAMSNVLGITTGAMGLVIGIPLALVFDVVVSDVLGTEEIGDSIADALYGVDSGKTYTKYEVDGMNSGQKGYLYGKSSQNNSWLEGAIESVDNFASQVANDILDFVAPNSTFRFEVKEPSYSYSNSPSGLGKGAKAVVTPFATGGFPEDGLFFANHNELVGQFSNGKTAVANNDQIVEGIKEGVYEAMMSASSNSKDGSVNVYLDGKLIANQVSKRQWQTQRAMGV